MSLPEESVAANTLPEVTTIPTGKKLIFTDPDTNEGGIITLENLTKQILQNLTTQTFTLDQGNLTLLQALNQLNSKTFMPIKFLMCSDQTLDLINNPTKLFDKQFQDTKSAIAYGIIFNDGTGTSIFGGGISFIIGYTYLSDNYGSQLVIKYNTRSLKIRCKVEGAWTELSDTK